MSSKKESLLNFPAVAPDLGLETTSSLVPLANGYFLTKEKRRIVDEAYRQRMGMVAVAAKVHFGMDKIAGIDQDLVATFSEVAEFVMKEKSRVEGQDHQQYADELSHHTLQLSAQQLIGIAKVGAATIGEIVAQSPYPPEPEEPEGFFQRLFGG